MESRTIQFETPHFLQSLFANDQSLLKILEQQIPVTITTRDNWVKLQGEKEAVDQAEEVFQHLESARRKGVDITEHSFQYAVDSVASKNDQPSIDDLSEMRLLGSASKAPVMPKTPGQMEYLQALQDEDVVFGIGPAGTGKTYLAVASALQALKDRKVQRIILTRPAVEAGEALGFLPGDLKEKIFPYLRPLYDAIYDMADTTDVERWIDKNIIEIAPLAYMRGRTLNKAYVILDEAQNTTREQMLMFLTRVGPGSRCAVTGDPTQIDLRRNVPSGLVEAIQALREVKGVRFCQLQGGDVVRHPVVKRIIAAYDVHRKREDEEAEKTAPKQPAA